MKTSFSLILAAFLALQPLVGIAMETDQYNLPPAPLADIGGEVSQFVRENVWTAVATLNAEIERHQACLSAPADKHAGCRSAEKEQKKLLELRSGDAVGKAVYSLLGDGTIFTTHAGDWLTTHDFAATPARYKADYGDSIYVTMPINYATLSPTIRMNAVELGTDKIDHFFQQGYKYYKIYTGQLAKGKSPEQAAKKAVSWGKMTEKTYFGLWVAGVYSNADLYANYAGMKFYLGLTQPVQIGNETRPATFALVNGSWEAASETGGSELLKPFVADQMNEALNPSVYSFIVYPVVRDVVRKRSCAEWKGAFPSLTKADFAARSHALELWNGEDYGFTRKDKMVTIADTCFNKESN
jgi:hypothetical protein